MIEQIIKTENGFEAVLNGQAIFIPDDAGNRHWQMVQDAIAADAVVQESSASPEAMLSKDQFLVRLTEVPTPPIFSADEAMAAMESFPPAFIAALASKPLQYRLNAVGLWKNISFVPRNHPLFCDVLAYYAAQNGLSEAQAVELGDLIFEGAE